jgi:hypothetical protein
VGEGKGKKVVVDVALLRARIIWLSAKVRFGKGANQATFKRSAVEKLLSLDLANDDRDPHGGLDAVLAVLPTEAAPLWDGDQLVVCDPDRRRRTVKEEAVKIVLDYWRDTTGRTARTEYTAARTGSVRSRLRAGYTVAQLCRAVDAMMLSSFHVEKGYTDVAHAFRPDRLERWLTSATDSASEEVERVAGETMRRRRAVAQPKEG